jgi:hypothetical protein
MPHRPGSTPQPSIDELNRPCSTGNHSSATTRAVVNSSLAASDPSLVSVASSYVTVDLSYVRTDPTLVRVNVSHLSVDSSFVSVLVTHATAHRSYVRALTRHQAPAVRIGERFLCGESGFAPRSPEGGAVSRLHVMGRLCWISWSFVCRRHGCLGHCGQRPPPLRVRRTLGAR